MKKLIQYLLALMVVLFTSLNAKSQYYYYNDRYYDRDVIFELGVSTGFMNCFTDVGSKKGFGLAATHLPYTKPAFGFYASAMYQNLIALRFETTWGNLLASDTYGANPSRGLAFRTQISEYALMAEFHPLMLKTYEDELPKFSPYILAGVGLFNFNPEYKISNGLNTFRWIDAKPLRLEGQGIKGVTTIDDYNLTQFNLPLGGGVKYELSQLFTLRAEFVYRKTFTDYLDDVSGFSIDPSTFTTNLSPQNAAYAQQIYNAGGLTQAGQIRGNPKTKDAYFSFNFKLGINLGRQKVRW